MEVLSPIFCLPMWKQKGHLLLHGDASDAQSVFLVVAVAIRVGKLSKNEIIGVREFSIFWDIYPDFQVESTSNISRMFEI